MKQKIKLQDIKQALLDDRFRNILPEELADDVRKFMKNPGCACNHPIYRKILKVAQKELIEYFPSKEIEEIEEKVSQNHWTVINCSIHELAGKLRELGPGRIQLDVARYEDQITAVVNHLDIGDSE